MPTSPAPPVASRISPIATSRCANRASATCLRFVARASASLFAATARRLAATTHALLETLRGRGLRLGLVSNAFDPPELARAELARLGVLERLDAVVFSGEAGARKPEAGIFLAALEALGGVPPERALMVGDRLREDVGGAAALGMATCQALWFEADESADGPEPDYRAFTQMDVLTAVRRLS